MASRRGLLLTGEILLIKKSLLSKCFVRALAVWHGYWLDGWVDRLCGCESVLASRKKVSGRALSLTDSICRGRGDTGQHQSSHKGCGEHAGLFTFVAPTEQKVWAG